MQKITSPHNPRIKEIVKLKKSSERRERGLTIVEGYQEIKMANRSGVTMKTLFYCPEFADNKPSPDTLLDKESVTVSKEAFEKMSYRQHPDGFLGIAKPTYISLDNIKLSKQALVIVLEAVEKPGNLGAILRTADAAKADAVIICGPQTDIFNPNVIRASLGTVFSNQVITSTTTETIEWLNKNSITSIAADPDAKKAYTEQDYTSPSAIVIGTEHEGLSQEWLRAANEKTKIPMRGRMDSLNASVSTAIIIFEALRQRQGR